MRKLLLCFAVVIVLAGAAHARLIGWDWHKKPTISLTQGAGQAYKALGTEAKDYYCIGASLAITSSQDGDWTYTFSSKSGKQKYVVVDFHGHTQVLDRLDY